MHKKSRKWENRNIKYMRKYVYLIYMRKYVYLYEKISECEVYGRHTPRDMVER